MVSALRLPQLFLSLPAPLLRPLRLRLRLEAETPLPLLRQGKKGLARRANLAGGEQAGENRARHAVLCQDSCDKTIGAGLAPALLVLLPFVYVTPRE